MNLYHGTSKNFNVGDMLRANKAANGLHPSVFASSHMRVSLEYAIHPVTHEWKHKNGMYIPFFDTVILHKTKYDAFVYRVDDRNFVPWCQYADRVGDEWVSWDKDVKIIEKIEITPALLVQHGYNVRMVRGNALTKALRFKWATSKLMWQKLYDAHLRSREEFEHILDKFSDRV